jgi:cytochrome P450
MSVVVDPDAVLLELFLTPDGKADPYPRYRQLLEHAPLHRSALDFWVVSRYEDCQFVLRDPRFGKDPDEVGRRAGLPEDVVTAATAFRRGRESLLMLNPPDHTRLRKLVSKAFTPRTVETLRPHIVRLTDDILDGIASRSGPGRSVDVMAELAFPLPVTVIGEMLGVPAGDRAQFQTLVRDTTQTLELTLTMETLEAAGRAFDTMEAYFLDLVAERRDQPGDDLLSKLIAVEEAGDQLSIDELIATAILLFAAGFETTTNLIGNGLYALLQHPGELGRVRNDRGLVPLAVEELLRWDSPVQVDGRAVFADVEVGGQVVPAGATVLTLLGAANRDPSHWTEPNRFDVSRDEGPPMSFGSGIHYCLGASLARVEGQVVFDRLLARFPHWEYALDGPPPRRDSLTLRGLQELPVAFYS